MFKKKKKGILPRQVMGRINVSEVFELKDIISHGSVFFITFLTRLFSL